MLPRGSGKRGGSSNTASRRTRKVNLNASFNNTTQHQTLQSVLNVSEKIPNGAKDEGERVSVTSNGIVSNRSGAMVMPCQSASVDSGSNCSPSRGSDVVAGTPGPSKALAKLNLDTQGDDYESPDAAGRKKKRGPRTAGGEKGGGRGLRQFSLKVCQKVESKGRTTYNEVADELVTEFANPNNAVVSPDQQQYDEKNIRRRVYDALNVLMALDIISKDKKEIQWKGLPTTDPHDLEDMKAEHIEASTRLKKKRAYVQELREQLAGLENLVDRNKHLYGSGNTPLQGVALPFILVQTRPQATVEIEISEDMQLVHFDFNSTPFELHDDAHVLKAMGFSDKLSDGSNVEGTDSFLKGGCSENDMLSANVYQNCLPSHARTSGSSFPLSATVKNCNSPLPGILKARVKNES